MRRPLLIGLIAAAIVVFLAISALLARGFSVSGAETAALTALVRAEARDNPAAVTALIRGCDASAACRTGATANSAALRRAGGIQIIQIQGSPSFAVTGSTGVDRVAWLAGTSLPRVQCVRVRRAGDLLQGFKIELLEVSARIKSDADCPSRLGSGEASGPAGGTAPG